MSIVSSTVGSSTYTGAKRRSRAASFSMCLRYSSSVVAPTHCSSPRARAGLSMLLASIAPCAAPAPTTVCSSSMKRMMSPSARWISSMAAFSRSSNSPRKRLPAIIAPRSTAPTSNTEEAEIEQFYEDLQDLLELTPKKDVLFIIGDWNAKVGSQETPGVTGNVGLGIRNEAGQRLIEFCQENALVITNTLFQQHKRRLYTWTSPDGQHGNQTDYILCSQRWRSPNQSAKTRLGANCV